MNVGSTVTIAGFRRRRKLVVLTITHIMKGTTMDKKTKKRRGPKVKVLAADKLVPGSIRLSAKQWEKFVAWGGAGQLRKVLNASRAQA